MTYFLDFDRTLFDTDAYNVSLAEHPACAPFAEDIRRVLAHPKSKRTGRDPERVRVWEKVSEALSSGALSFTPGELARFLYEDAASFLEAHQNECVLVTYGEETRQRLKIESAIPAAWGIPVWYTGTEDKAAYLARSGKYDGTPGVFVDDLPLELSALETAFPTLTLYEIRRDGEAGGGRWPLIHSFSELP